MANQEEILKIINSKRIAILENLVKSTDLMELKEKIEKFLDKNLIGENLLALKYKKFRAPGQKNYTFLTNSAGYPVDGGGGERWIKPYIDFFEKFIAEKTLVERIEDNNYWVESRVQNNEQHLFVGDRKDKNGEKVHLIIGEAGDIRIDKKDKHPSEMMEEIKSIFVREDGTTIKTTIELLKEKPGGKREMVFKNNAYYKKDGNGPFCTRCWDKNNEQIRITPTFLGSNYATCPECKNEVNYTGKEDDIFTITPGSEDHW